MKPPYYQVSQKEIKILIENSQERLESALVLMKIKNFRDAISRSYYAILDVARALLLIEGHFAKTHAGVITLFNLKFVKTNQISAKYARIFSEAEKDRLEADYKFLETFNQKDAERIYQKAVDFAAMANKRLKGKLEPKSKNIFLKSVVL